MHGAKFPPKFIANNLREIVFDFFFCLISAPCPEIGQTSTKEAAFDSHIFTARVRSTREGTVFTGVCLFTFRGEVPTFQMVGGYLLRFRWWGWGTYLGWGGGVPTYGWGGGGTYLWLGWGVPTYGQGGGIPTLAGRYLP